MNLGEGQPKENESCSNRQQNNYRIPNYKKKSHCPPANQILNDDILDTIQPFFLVNIFLDVQQDKAALLECCSKFAKFILFTLFLNNKVVHFCSSFKKVKIIWAARATPYFKDIKLTWNFG
jgi:hypothetical protein